MEQNETPHAEETEESSQEVTPDEQAASPIATDEVDGPTNATTADPSEEAASSSEMPADPHHDGANRGGRWTRPVEGRLLAGVAAGVARRTELPLWFVRAAFVVTSFAGGFGIAAYLASWALMPREGDAAAAADRWHRSLERADSPSKKLGLALIVLGALIALGATGILASPLSLAAVLVVAGVALLRPAANEQ